MFTTDRFQTILDGAGGLVAVATAMGVTPQVVVHWRNRGVPAKRAQELAAVTGAPVRDLCRNWQAYWPELADGAHLVDPPSEQPELACKR